MSGTRADRLAAALRGFWRAAALAGTVSFVMCGVRGSPRPPQMEDQYGKRYADAGVGCDDIEAPHTVPVGRTTEEICDSCDALRQKRERCGVTEPLSGRCKALCMRGDWKRDSDPGQDIEARTTLMKEWGKTPPDSSRGQESAEDGGPK